MDIEGQWANAALSWSRGGSGEGRMRRGVRAEVVKGMRRVRSMEVPPTLI